MTKILYKSFPIEEYYKIKPDIELLLSSMSCDKLKENYTIENFFKDKPLYISIIYKDDEPFEASTVITRDAFSNGCRVLNRLMVDSAKRDTKITKHIPITTLTMLKQQLDFVKDQFDFAFISREFNTYRFCKRFANDCSNFLDHAWTYETERFLVCNWKAQWGIPNNSCLQWIAWTKFKEIDTFPLLSESYLRSNIFHKT
jgi:hypothetical protein